MRNGSITYRLARATDLDACADVLYTADDALSASRGLPVGPRNREALVRLFAHMHRFAPDRWWVAEQDARIVGFGGSSNYEDMVYLGFLFVLPDTQAAGIGRRLLFRLGGQVGVVLPQFENWVLLQFLLDAFLQRHQGQLENLHRLDHARREELAKLLPQRLA